MKNRRNDLALMREFFLLASWSVFLLVLGFLVGYVELETQPPQPQPRFSLVQIDVDGTISVRENGLSLEDCQADLDRWWYRCQLQS